jgi:pheromone shutdown protein TraB
MKERTMTDPNGDGSRSLTRESKLGHLVQLILSAAALAAAGWLTDVDLSTLPGWLIATATVAATTLAGVLTSWATKNKTSPFSRYR